MAYADIVLIYHVADEEVGRQVELFLARAGRRIIETNLGELRAFKRPPNVVKYYDFNDLVGLSDSLLSATTLLIVVSECTRRMLTMTRMMYAREMARLADRTIYLYEEFLPEEVLYEPHVFEIDLCNSCVLTHMKRHLDIVFPTMHQGTVRRIVRNCIALKRYTVNAFHFLRSKIKLW